MSSRTIKSLLGNGHSVSSPHRQSVMPESRHQGEQASALAPSIPVNVQDRHMDNGKEHLYVPGAFLKPHSGYWGFPVANTSVLLGTRLEITYKAQMKSYVENTGPWLILLQHSLLLVIPYVTSQALSFVPPISALPLGATYALPASPLSLRTRLLDPKVKKETSRLFNLHPHSKTVTLLARLH